LVEKEKPIELKKDLKIKKEEEEETDVLQEARNALRKKDLDTVWGIRESGGQLMFRRFSYSNVWKSGHGSWKVVHFDSRSPRTPTKETSSDESDHTSRLGRLPGYGDQYQYQSETLLKHRPHPIKHHGKNQTFY